MACELSNGLTTCLKAETVTRIHASFILITVIVKLTFCDSFDIYDIILVVVHK